MAKTANLGLVSFAIATLTGALLHGEPPSRQTVTKRPERDRSPRSVAVAPGGRFCLSANHTADSVSLVDLGRNAVTTELDCGRGPVDLVWTNATTALVTLLHDDAVAVVNRDGNRLSKTAVIAVGDEPRSIVLAPSMPARNGAASTRRAFVAVSGADEVAVIDLEEYKVTDRIPVGGIPRNLVVSPDGRWLVTCCSVPGEVFVHDAVTYKPISRRRVFDDAFNLGVPIVLPDSSACVLPSPINRTFPVSNDNIEKGWVIDNRLTRLPLPDGEYWEQKQIGLDIRGNAVADLHSVALSPDGKRLVATCGGSHELLVLDFPRIPWPPADPGDFLPPKLADDESRFRRLELGGRPLGVQFLDERRVVVANYFLNALQVVDVAETRLVSTIPLGGPDKPSLARRGEMIFHDADRCLDSWFSCSTCHPGGHTSGQTFDTLNDGNYDTYKLTPSLRGVTRTGPWTWHGWQTSLHASLRKSLNDTLSTSHAIRDDDIEAMFAYLKTLSHSTSPARAPHGELTAAARRGRMLFEGKAGCTACHSGQLLTSDGTYEVGLESPRYFYPSFNPPSLRGLHSRRRFLHDGRADSLEEVLTRHHQPQKLAGEKLAPDELRDLIAYLKSL